MTKLDRMAKAIYEISPVWLGPPGSPDCPGKMSWEMLSDASLFHRYKLGSFAKDGMQRVKKQARLQARAALIIARNHK